MIAEVANPSGAILRRYVPGPGVDETVVWYEGTGTTDRRWHHADERGSVIALSDGTGAMLNINRYDEFGIPQGTNAGRFQYTGQAWLAELGMQYSKARIYSPTLGRFMQTDPIGYGDGLNWYDYVHGDPVNSTDPSGLNEDPNGPPGTTVIAPRVTRPVRRFIDPFASFNSGGNFDVFTNVSELLALNIARMEMQAERAAVQRKLAKRRGRSGNGSCAVNSTSSNVFIQGNIVGAAAGSLIYGTITDPATGAQVNFRSEGLSAITGAGRISFSGLIPGGINALSQGLTVSGYTFNMGAQKGAGNGGVGWGSITLSNYSGKKIGKLDANFAGLGLGVGAKGGGIGGVLFAADFGQVDYIVPGC